jgi:hypothetical protein
VRAYVFLHKYLIGELGNSIVAWVTIDQSIFLEMLHGIIAWSEPALQGAPTKAEIGDTTIGVQ